MGCLGFVNSGLHFCPINVGTFFYRMSSFKSNSGGGFHVLGEWLLVAGSTLKSVYTDQDNHCVTLIFCTIVGYFGQHYVGRCPFCVIYLICNLYDVSGIVTTPILMWHIVVTPIDLLHKFRYFRYFKLNCGGWDRTRTRVSTAVQRSFSVHSFLSC
jgi:hypothetical protein